MKIKRPFFNRSMPFEARLATRKAPTRLVWSTDSKSSSDRLASVFRGGLAHTADPLFSHLPRFHLTRRAMRFFSAELGAQLAGYDPLEELRGRLPEAFGAWHPLSQAQYLETAFLLPGYILSSQGDRMAMAHGVEGRFQFLDHRVV